MELKYHNWNEVSIKIYGQISKLIKEYENNPELYLKPVLSILYNIPENEIGLLKMYEVQKMINDSQWINHFSFDKENRIEKVTINNIKCKINYDLSDFTYQQYLDYQEFFSHVNDDISYLANVLATIILPEGKKYGEDYNIQEFTDMIEDYLPITSSQNIMFFFLKTLLLSLERIQTSSTYQRTMMKKTLMKKRLEII